MAFNTITASPEHGDEFQHLLDTLYKGYQDELETMVEEAADEIQTAVERGLDVKQQIVADWTQAAAKRADDYYQAVRQAWQEYAGVTMPSLDEYKLIDTERALWETQTGLINSKYVGLRYRDLANGTSGYGVTFDSLWPELGDVDNAQQFIADMMRNAARLQTMHNMRHDPTKPRWARVPQGRKTCAFCTMLASRGFAYSSEETAGAYGNRYHPDCDCKVIPSWGKQTLKGYDPAQMAQWWREAKGASGSNQTETAVLKAMRRLHPEHYTDGITPKPFVRWSGKPLPPTADELQRLSDFETTMPQDKYTKEQKINALTDWTGSAYEKINGYLFGNKDLLDNNVKSAIERIDEALADHTTQNAFTVDRLMRIDTFKAHSMQELIATVKKGDQFQHAGYMATSIDVGGKSAGDGDRIITRILVPSGSNAAYLKDISHYSHEHEMLLPRGKTLEFERFMFLKDGTLIACLRMV